MALERGLEGDSGLFTEDSGQEAEEEGRAKARGRPGQGGSGGEAEGAARPAPRACSAEVQRVPPGGKGRVPGSNVQTGKHWRTSEGCPAVSPRTPHLAPRNLKPIYL